jgi:EmrB/QacA subfamily drug resistance transporter
VYFLASLDQTIVATALPTIGRELGDLRHTSWIVSAYLLTATAAAPIYGKLSDLYGRRRMVLVSVGLFVTTSVFCAIAWSMDSLIAARALQGIGGGGLIAMSHATIADVVSPRERGRYTGYLTTSFAAGNVAGPVLGGLLVQYVAWPAIFWINVPFGVAGFLVASRALRKLPVRGIRHAIDYAGAGLFIAAVTCALGAIVSGGNDLAWSDPRLLVLGAAAILLGGGFLVRQSVAAEPIMPLRLFRNHSYATAVGMAFLALMTFIGAIFLLPMYMQAVGGLSPAEASVLMIPVTFGAVLASGATGVMMSRWGRYKIFPVVGLGVASVALLLLALVAGHSPEKGELVAFLTLFGLGIGCSMTVTVVIVQNAVEPRDIGVATGSIAFFRSLGGALGVAVFSAVLAQTLPPDLAGPGGNAAAGLEALRAMLSNTAGADLRLATGHAFFVTFLVVAAVTLAAFLLICRLKETPLKGGR